MATPNQPARPQNPAIPARERWLRAGLEAWKLNPGATPFEALTVDDVTRAAERGTGAFYNMWPSAKEPGELGGMEAYQQDLLTWILDPDRLAPTRRTMANIKVLEDGDEFDPRKVVHDLAKENFNGYLEDGIPRLAMIASWAAAPFYSAGHYRALEEVHRSYEVVMELAAAFDQLFEILGRGPRDPWDSVKIAEVVGCLAEGMLFRAIIGSPGAVRVDSEMFADTAVALLAATTMDLDATSKGPLTFDEWTQYNIPAKGHKLSAKAEAVIRAANVVYARSLNPLSSMTTEAVAKEAGCSSRTVEELFPPAPMGLSVPLWRDLVYGPLCKFADEARSGGEPPTRRLESILIKLASLAHRHQDLALSFQYASGWQASQHGNVTAECGARSLCPMHVPIVQALDDAYKLGSIGRELGPRPARLALAEFLASSVITRVVTRPHDSFERIENFVRRTLIAGIVARSDGRGPVGQQRRVPTKKLVTVEQRDFTADLLERFYDQVLAPSMPAYSMLPLDEVKTLYLGGAPIGPAAITLQNEEPIAGLLTQYFHRSKILLIMYLAVREDLRGTGRGTAALEASIPAWKKELGARAIIAETEDPRCKVASPETGDPVRRLALYGRLGAELFPMAYFHPSQCEGGSRGYGHLLIAYGCEGSLPQKALTDFLDDYFAFYEGHDVVTSDSEYLAMRSQASDHTGNIRLIPISEDVNINRSGIDSEHCVRCKNCSTEPGESLPHCSGFKR